MAQIDILMSPQTVEALQAGGYSLYAFKAMQLNLVGPSPLVWYRTQSLTTTTTVAWQETYQAFISQSPINPGGMITPQATLDLHLGLAIAIANDGTLSIQSGGTTGGVDVFNYAVEPWHVGLSQTIGEGLGPMFVLPVYSEQMQTVTPVARVLLLITQEAMEPGEVMDQAGGPGVFIDFTAGEDQQTVEFDIDQGWSWGGGAWAQAVAPGADIQTLLVQVMG
jgi:hypothetical protein